MTQTAKISLAVVGGLIALVVIGAIFVISVRNGLIDRQERVRENWSQIDTQLQRRVDLIPNLVETVKGYAAHENKIFSEIAEARSRLLTASGPEAKAESGAVLESALGRLLAIAENYPDLKANQNFIRLQDELAGTENRISVARTRYNDCVRDFNAAIRKFPGSLFASGMGLTAAEYFQPPAGAAAVQTPPQVRF
ncbi:LemA family protein [Victivallis sp. Marseille-Q1083]|uniref:LemA family protein n=1 Tax=Victivallis sp. Marseille-Q1083 TaxID=2717288 RepID=UPI001588C5C9|nr:LemA family protein [Victivallis sp. Marseille-Q1083]